MFTNKITRLFLVLSPLYYFPVFLTGHSLGEETFYIRIIKDLLIVGLLILWLPKRIILNTISRQLLLLLTLIFLLGLIKLVQFQGKYFLPIVRMFIEYPIFFLIGTQLYNKNDIKRDIIFMIGISLIVSLIGIIEYSTGGIDTVYNRYGGYTRIISTLFNPNALGWYLCFTNILILNTLKNRSFDFNKVYITAILFINLIAILFSGSRSSILVLILTSLFVLNKKTLFKIIPILFIIVFVLVNYIINIMDLRILSAGLQSSRSYIYLELIQFILDQNLIDILIGSNLKNFDTLQNKALIFDSQLLYDLTLGGLVFISLKYTLVILLLIRKNSTLLSVLKPVVLSLIFISFLGNVLMLFPHGIYFWIILGILSNENKIKYTGNENCRYIQNTS